MSEEIQLRLVPEYTWREYETLHTEIGSWSIHNELVQTEDALDRMVSKLSQFRRKAYDTETSGLNPHLGARICGHSVAVIDGENSIHAWYVPVRHRATVSPQLRPEDAVEALRLPLSWGRIDGHHLKFDAEMARADTLEISVPEWHDTSVMAATHNENEDSFALKKLTAKYLYEAARSEESALQSWMSADARGLKIPYKKRKTTSDDLIGSPTYMELYGYARTPIELCGIYGCHDVIYTLLLAEFFSARIFPQFSEVYTRDMRVSKILFEMEWAGMPVSVETIRQAERDLKRDLDLWLKRIRSWVQDENFEPSNDNDIRKLLYVQLNLEPPKTTDGDLPSVDQEALRLLSKNYPQHSELINGLVSFAKVEKLYTTYGASFLRVVDPNGYIHSSYNQIERKEAGTPVTGRLSSQDPNAQNIFKKAIELQDGSKVEPRRYYVVPPGRIYVYIDLSQIELRTLTWLSRDPELLRCYANDLDIHQMTADEVTGGNRDIAKQVNFGSVLGLTYIGFSRRLPYYYDDPERAKNEAKVLLERFYEKYRGIEELRETMSRHMRNNNNELVSAFGRPRRIDWISSDIEWQRGRAERQMMSTLISGTAADIHKEILIRSDYVLRKIEPRGRIAQSIHDEIVFDLPLDTIKVTLPPLKRCFEYWPVFEDAGVPIKASVEVTTTTWADKRQIEVLADGSFDLAT